MLEINIWYASQDNVGVLGSRLTDVAKALSYGGNIGHINITLHIYGTKEKLTAIKSKYADLHFTSAPPTYQRERIGNKQPFLDEPYFVRGKFTEGISITHSFWPANRAGIGNFIGSLFRLGGKIKAEFNTHEKDMDSENYEGGPKEIVHQGPNTRQMQKKEDAIKALSKEKEIYVSTHRKPIADELFVFLKRDGMPFNKLPSYNALLEISEKNRPELTSALIAETGKQLDTLNKEILKNISETETKLTDIIIQAYHLVSEYCSDFTLDSISMENSAIKSGSFNLITIDDKTQLSFINILYANLTKIQQALASANTDVSKTLDNLLTELKHLHADLYAHDEAISYCRRTQSKLLAIEQYCSDHFDVEINVLAEEYAALREATRSHEVTKGRSPDSSITLITDNDHIHYIDETEILEFIRYQKMNMDKEDNQYDIFKNNCSHNVKRAIINAIPAHTKKAFKAFFDDDKSYTDFFSLDSLETPGQMENWLGQLDGLIHRMNDDALDEVDQFTALLLHDKKEIDEPKKNNR